MEKRVLKQIIYGGGFLTIIFAILSVIYFIWLKPAPTCFDNKQNQNEAGVDCGGPCMACEIRTLAPIETVWTRYFKTDGEQTAIAAEIKNSNINYGADKFSYSIDIFDKRGNKLKSILGNSFIYPSEIKYLVEFSDVKFSNVGEIKVSFVDMDWKTDAEFPRPKMQIRDKSTVAKEGGGAEVGGVVVNENAYSLSKIMLVGFLATSNGIKISVSKTELSNVEAFRERQFKIIFSKNISVAAQTAPGQIEFNAASPNLTQVFVEALR